MLSSWVLTWDIYEIGKFFVEDAMHPDRHTPSPSLCPAPPSEIWRKAALVREISAHLFQVSVEELASPTRRRASAALARQVAMYVCHVTLGLSYSDVGELFGRDRTTASHACKVIEERRDEREFDELVRRIEDAIQVLGVTPPVRIPAFGCR